MLFITLAILAAGAAAPYGKPSSSVEARGSQQTSRPAGHADTHCKPGEAVIWSCRIKRKAASVCNSGGSPIYRFGRPGRTEIELGRETPPTYTRARNQSGSLERLRFVNGRHSYMPYHLDTGDPAGGGNGQFAGVDVWRDGVPLHSLDCDRAAPQPPLDRRLFPGVRDEPDETYNVF